MDTDNLCSRKLLDLLRVNDSVLSPPDKRRIRNELRKRRHYLTELSALSLKPPRAH